MPELQQSIREDLAGVFTGEFRFDPLTREIYASDASLYQLTPIGVAYPRSLDDVVVLGKYAEEHSLPLIPRGAGSGVAGGALGTGLIVDFSRHMTRIVSIGEETVTVEAGVVRDRLNDELRERGRYFPPDPANTNVTTVGGMLGVDAAGSHAVRVGSMRDHVQNVQVVLPGGQAFLAGVEPLLDPTQSGGGGAERNGHAFKHELVGRLGRLLRQHEALIRERQPPLMRNTSGYHLRTVLSGNTVNLPRLLVGSEGTLALFASATLDTAPLPAQRGVALLLFGQLESAIRTVQAVNDQQPTACDLIDRRLLSLARDADPGFAAIIPKAAEAGLIVEQTGFSERQVRDRIRMIVEAARAQESQVIVAQQAFDDVGIEFLWSLPRRVVPLLARLKSGARPVPLVEDIAVPPEALHDFLVRAQRVMQRHQLTASLYAHAASGQVHLRPFLPLPGEQDADRIEAIARDLYEVVFSVGGSISGEKGDGLSRTAFIRSQYGPLYRVFQQVKDVFDPQNLLNPGKIISDDPHTTIRHFRPVEVADASTVPLQLRWQNASLSETAVQCNGCGSCRSTEPGLRMCPFFRVDAVEEASPRAKANAMRGFAGGTLDFREMSSDSMKRLASLCFNCKQCRDECPSNVDIPHLMIEAKAGYVAANGLSRTDWFLARAHSWGRLGCTVAPLANRAINNPAARWLIERFLGIARGRKLPAFARRAFLSTLGEEYTDPGNVSRTPKSVVYFADGYVNHHDPQLGHALLAVLKHNGVPVHVPLEQASSGMAMICAGDLGAARKLAQHNVRVLSELARDGHTIVCTEPSAAICLREEYPLILDHPDIELIAGQVVEAGEFLRQLHADGKLRTDFQPLTLSAGYHLPCHVAALSRESGFTQLLSLIPGLSVNRIERGCSGMAGAFGLTRENFETSLKMGEALIRRMAEPDLAIGCTECSSCKLQMEQGTPTPTVHPLKLMALAYGLMPELRDRLKPSRRRLVVT
ncbi:MAG: FAD-binding protein [Planctomycetaceae bacterium]|nr:FAD-binding protein [Planctomycetaceae bacterium]